MSVTVTAKPLINTKYAENAATTQYTVGSSKKALIDKFTVTNITGSGATLQIHLIPNGDTVGNEFLIYSATIAANTAVDLTVFKNQYLDTGDFISTEAGTANALVIRCSGREVTTST